MKENHLLSADRVSSYNKVIVGGFPDCTLVLVMAQLAQEAVSGVIEAHHPLSDTALLVRTADLYLPGSTSWHERHSSYKQGGDVACISIGLS